jgi:serine/threonine protein phosphatase PrpC
MTSLVLRWGAATDVGRVRGNNEDKLFTSPRLLVVADGMGGHSGGEIASDMAVRTLETQFVDATKEGLLEAAYEANRVVHEAAGEDPDLRGMGTTLVAIAPVDDGDALAWINVGDSRLYLLRGGELTQVSQDHSLVEEAVRSGELSPEEARTHPQRNIVTRALGIGANVTIDGDRVDAVQDDRFLLCSDGLSDYVEDTRIGATLRQIADPAEASSELVRIANEAGGRDNITVVVVDVVVDDGTGSGAVTDVPTTALSHAEDMAGFTTALKTEPEDVDALARAGEMARADSPPSTLSRRERRRAKRAARPRRFTWRVAIFTLLFVAVLAAAAGAVGYYARHTYYVGLQGDHVVVYRGKPGGVLWFDPTFEKDSGLTLAGVPASQVDQIRSGKEFASLGDADTYVTNLRSEFATEHPTTTTTTATTSTTTSTTTPSVGSPVN